MLVTTHSRCRGRTKQGLYGMCRFCVCRDMQFLSFLQEPLSHLLNFLPRLQRLRLAAIDNIFDPAIECIESICDDEPLLMGLHIIVSISRRGECQVCGWGIGMGCQ